jgi:hypothetical protein
MNFFTWKGASDGGDHMFTNVVNAFLISRWMDGWMDGQSVNRWVHHFCAHNQRATRAKALVKTPVHVRTLTTAPAFCPITNNNNKKPTKTQHWVITKNTT